MQTYSRITTAGPALALMAAVIVCFACAARHGTIGAMLGQRSDGRLFIRATPARLASAEAGLKAGDEILLVDGKDVRFMNKTELHEALSGETGTPVKLTVLRQDDVVRVTVRRTPATPYRGDGSVENSP